ncbi:hypothetical protein PAJ_1421 [Pantoea ananatis AJ13355]|uniref:Uncharacterized protein n=1 Tax=Pantoea ananatis (strain AJ13355) TaxID=932677 RepID=A0A0H3KWS5_PANAA|nr:hypothetical protein PAJ_1421 [Pantoea ananatis AJ13355]
MTVKRRLAKGESFAHFLPVALECQPIQRRLRLKNNRAVTINKNTLAQYFIQRAAQHVFFDVASGPHHLFGGVTVIDINHVLHDDRTFIKVIVNVVCRCTNDFHTTFVSLMVRPCADKGRQKRVVNVNNLIWVALHKARRQHAHIFGKHHIIGLITINLVRHAVVMLFARQAFVADQNKRNIETLYQRTQGVVITDNGGDFHIEAAKRTLHQQVAKAVCFFGNENNNTATACAMQFTHGTLRKGTVEIGQQGGVVKNPLQLCAHKKTPGAMINKLIVLHDIQFVLVTNIGDFGDQTFCIGTNGS